MKNGLNEKVPHRFFTPKRAPWLRFCWRCGIVALKNEASIKIIKKGCYKEDEAVCDVTGS